MRANVAYQAPRCGSAQSSFAHASYVHNRSLVQSRSLVQRHCDGARAQPRRLTGRRQSLRRHHAAKRYVFLCVWARSDGAIDEADGAEVGVHFENICQRRMLSSLPATYGQSHAGQRSGPIRRPDVRHRRIECVRRPFDLTPIEPHNIRHPSGKNSRAIPQRCPQDRTCVDRASVTVFRRRHGAPLPPAFLRARAKRVHRRV